MRAAHDPCRQDTSSRASSDEKLIRIDVTRRDRGIDSAHQIVKIMVWIIVIDEVREFLAVGGGATWICIENHVARGGKQLEVRRESRPVASSWAPVNFKYQG